MRRRFLGGVHPVSYKESTRRKPIMPLEEPPKQVAIPLTMCTGGGAVPVVKPGDKVTVGQVIAKPEEGGVYVHSSVSGRVRAIEPRPHPWGGQWDAIVIDNDGQDTACPDLPEPMDWSRMDRAQVLERICQAGITSMGGGASPTHLRIARSVGRVDTLIVSAAECEPYLTADHRLLLEHGGPGAPVGPDALSAAAGGPGRAGGGRATSSTPWNFWSAACAEAPVGGTGHH